MVNRRRSSPTPVNRWSRVLGLISVGVLATSLARAGSNDEEAKALSEKALFDDFLNLRFDDASSKLNEAIALCESDCSNHVMAEVHRDLGVVYVAGKEDREKGVAAFVQALKTDPSVTLDPDLSTPEIESAFAEAQEQAGSADGESDPGEEPPTDAIQHTPPEEQLISTPLPLFVGVAAGADVAAVSAFVRGFGMPDYKEIELSKRADGFGGQTSCADVGGTTGEFQYYLVALDDSGEVVSQTGSSDTPIVVTIKKELDGDPPRLPGAAPPEQCARASSTTSECPPDFPGCATSLGDWGSGQDEPEPDEGDGADFKRHWLSLSFQSDFLMLPASSDTCSRERDLAWECYYSNDEFRNPNFNQAGYKDPADGKWKGAGSTGGGLTAATMRILIGYDFAVTQGFRVGTRVGFAFGGRPPLNTTDIDPVTMTEKPVSEAPFIPVHAEARLAYWFGDSDSAVRPHVSLSGGLAQTDAKLIAEIVDNNRALSPTDCPRDDSGTIFNNRCSLAKVEAWNSTGPIFAAGGLGLMLPFGGEHGLDVEAKFFATFPESGLGGSVQAGYVIGL